TVGAPAAVTAMAFLPPLPRTVKAPAAATAMAFLPAALPSAGMVTVITAPDCMHSFAIFSQERRPAARISPLPLTSTIIEPFAIYDFRIAICEPRPSLKPLQYENQTVRSGYCFFILAGSPSLLPGQFDAAGSAGADDEIARSNRSARANFLRALHHHAGRL